MQHVVRVTTVPCWAIVTAMTTELAVLAWGCVLAFVHIFAAAQVKTRQYGVTWNMGARDETLPPPQPIVGRMIRAQANFFETFPIVVGAILVDAAANLFDRWTQIGAIVWIVARVIYLPLYALGVPVVRTLVWGASVVGIVMLLKPAIAAAL
ncbi:MAPEG family protein [Sphingosinicella ginsenosidimutans]